jgi:metallo-beta-lactamase family protein
VLLECGLYQGRRADTFQRNQNLPFDPRKLDAVILSHSHIDHSGNLPNLLKNGYYGPIFATPATSHLANIMLLDSAHIQEEDAAYKLKRHRKERRQSPRPVEPLYTTGDAERVQSHFQPVPYETKVNVAKGITATFHDAGHVFGSSMITVNVSRDGQSRTILFSGDVGRAHQPMLHDPTTFERADYVLIESTYGDRLHEPERDVPEALAEVIDQADQAGGNLVIPCFALERSQNILYYLSDLLRRDRIRPMMVFLDSPMAIKITEIFDKYPELYDDEMRRRIASAMSPFKFPGLTMTRTVDESKAINRIKGTAAILAGSGMCTGGRIKHHLANNIERPECTILFVGYQARNTLGRTISSGAREVRIHGQLLAVRARIARISGFSAHADRQELFGWLSTLKKKPRGVFVVHGEIESAESFADLLRQHDGWRVTVPKYRDTVTLD